MRVIFWDVDGVLNHPGIWGAWSKLGWSEALDESLVARARAVVHALGAKCVLSSTWRLTGYERTLDCLARRGWPEAAADFIGATPHLGTYRGVEIGAWLTKHPDVTEFAIVDDDGDMTTFMHRLVQTNGAMGLQPVDCERIKGLFS